MKGLRLYPPPHPTSKRRRMTEAVGMPKGTRINYNRKLDDYIELKTLEERQEFIALTQAKTELLKLEENRL